MVCSRSGVSVARHTGIGGRLAHGSGPCPPGCHEDCPSIRRQPVRRVAPNWRNIDAALSYTRIEATGTASHESVKAVASCLELSIAELRQDDQLEAESPPRFGVQRTAISAAAMVLAVVTAFSMHSAFAERVLLDLGVTMNDQNEYLSQVLLDDGEDIELRMERFH